MKVNPLTPLTTLIVCNNVPLDSMYNDTLDFSSVSAQESYFKSKKKFLFENLSPIRLQNAIRLPINADKLFDCNYVMFKNANFSNRWFYAFIKKINFINVNMSEIEIEIDVMQTWQFDYNVKPSFVEREHSETDNIGDSLTSENVDIGELVTETGEQTNLFKSYVAVIASAETEVSGYVGGMITGLKYTAGLIDNAEQVQQVLDLLKKAVDANKTESIVSTFVMPFNFYTTESTPVVKRFEVNKNLTSLGTYTPKNKKLLTFPFNFLEVSNSDGASKSYRYEYFQGEKSAFVLECGMSCNPEIVLEPIAYMKQQFNVDESLSLGGFPQFAFAIDTFRAWLSQNATSTGISLLSSSLALGAGIASTNVPMALGGATGVANFTNNLMQTAYKGNLARGTQGSNTLVATREKDFYFYNRHVREDYAKIIDDYFTKYGYNTSLVKIPNTKTRKSFNYIKTNNCTITGSIPFEDIEKIKGNYNNGITFWHGDFVGDYDRDNTPV